MNRHFDITGQNSWEGFPNIAFGRIDYFEQIEDEEETFFLGISSVDIISLKNSLLNYQFLDLTEYFEDFWTLRFKKFDNLTKDQVLKLRKVEEWFDNIRLFHLILTGKKQDQPKIVSIFGQESLDTQRSDWMQIELSSTRSNNDEIEVKAFGGLFSEPNLVYLKKITHSKEKDKSILNLMFSMENWPNSSPSQIKNKLKDVNASYLACYDVGQGLATSLLGPYFSTTLHYDIGTGVYQNAHTRNSGLILCNSEDPPIILSHWDTDHWAGAFYCVPKSDDKVFRKRIWIAPRDLYVGPTHIAFAEQIIRSGGRVLLWNSSSSSKINIKLTDGRTLSLIKGSGKGRNESGIALMVENMNNHKWLLTGDVEYRYIFRLIPPLGIAAMTVPHHGAKFKSKSIHPGPNSGPYRRLIYSFGQGNTYNHPHVQCISSHIHFG